MAVPVFFVRCREKHVARIVGEPALNAYWQTVPYGFCPTGQHAAKLTVLKAVEKPEVACNEKCVTATGPSCECACAGANHGVEVEWRAAAA